MFAVVFGHFLHLIFGNVCHVCHLEMFALAFQDVSIEDVCICISFSFASLPNFTALLKAVRSESRSTDSHLFYLC